jgi:hypothetical protein
MCFWASHPWKSEGNGPYDGRDPPPGTFIPEQMRALPAPQEFPDGQALLILVCP